MVINVIDFLSNWSEQIVVAVIIATIIEMILPNNKNKKYIKMVIGIYVLFNIVSPFIKNNSVFSFENLDLESYTVKATDDTINQETMDERLQELYIQELEKNIKEKIKEQGYETNKCKIDAVLIDEKNSGIKKIELKIYKSNSENTVENNIESNIDMINKVEINIGHNNSKNDNENTQITKQEIENLKITLSDYYEIDKTKIDIKAN